MNFNFHTHTCRCHHAKGKDEEYVKMAIERGIKILGFSDHAPMHFGGGYSSYFKMEPSEAEEYMASLTALKEKYKDDIEIHVGFETEYYPSIFEENLKLWRSLGAEYIILGAHFTLGAEWEDGRKASKSPSGDEQLLYYTDNVCEAMETGKFTYIAHPDILNYVGDNAELYRECVERLVKCSVECDLPLEINLLGMRNKINYPSDRFWEIASPLKPKVIIGADAHRPKDLFDPDNLKEGLTFAEKHKLKLIDKLEFKRI